MNMIIGMGPGSYDGFTLGHKWLSEQGAQLFDEFIVAVGSHPTKKQNYTFSVDERVDMVKRSLRSIPNIRVEHYEDKYMVDFAKSVGAQYILRSIRSTEDYAEEFRNICGNRSIDPSVEAIFMMPPSNLSHISSSFVKGLVGYGGWERNVKNNVPQPTFKRFLEKFDGGLIGFKPLWKRIGASGDSIQAYNDIKSRYCAPDRFYHGLDHVINALEDFEDVSHLAENPDQVRMGIWMHDAILNPMRNDNEEKSAEYAEEILGRANISSGFIDGVRNLVLATKHNYIPKEADARIITSLDLIPLGLPQQVFRENGMNKREESPMLSNQEYRKGESRFASGMLSRESIYTIEQIRNKYEKPARENLAALL